MRTLRRKVTKAQRELDLDELSRVEAVVGEIVVDCREGCGVVL